MPTITKTTKRKGGHVTQTVIVNITKGGRGRGAKAVKAPQVVSRPLGASIGSEYAALTGVPYLAPIPQRPMGVWNQPTEHEKELMIKERERTIQREAEKERAWIDRIASQIKGIQVGEVKIEKPIIDLQQKPLMVEQGVQHQPLMVEMGIQHKPMMVDQGTQFKPLPVQRHESISSREAGAVPTIESLGWKPKARPGEVRDLRHVISEMEAQGVARYSQLYGHPKESDKKAEMIEYINRFPAERDKAIIHLVSL